MKRVTLIAITLSLIFTSAAQVGISPNGTPPDSSAVLHLDSQTKGLLLPRLTAAEITNLPDPADGLLVYNTDSHRFCYFNQALMVWQELDIGAGFVNTRCGTVTDTCGNVYNTILIGSQCWMASNLMTTKLNDGTDILQVTDNTSWANTGTPAYCWYGNDSATYGGTYGAIYNGFAAFSADICPVGWHVPSRDEWCTLLNHVDIGTIGCSSMGWVGTDAGGNLKETGTAHWSSPNTGATNSSGFTGLPGGMRDVDGSFAVQSQQALFWSSTELPWPDNYMAWAYVLAHNTNRVYAYNNFEKLFGMSIRCVRD